MSNQVMGPHVDIDQRSASVLPRQEDIADWASGRRIFVSSLITDMLNERAASRSAIADIGADPVMFEHELGAQDVSADEAYLAGVRGSDVYVGLWGPRYGVRMSDGYSATHAEFLEAEKQGLRLCLFVGDANSADFDGQQRDLIAGARNLYTTSTWQTIDDLQERIRTRLMALAAEDLAPWVRLGPLFFRATDISGDGTKLIIKAQVRSASVHAELVQLRDARTQIVFASTAESKVVRIDRLSSTMRSTNVHDETIELSVVSQGQSASAVFRLGSINGVPSDEVQKKSLAAGLFGEPASGDSFSPWGALTAPVDPLKLIRRLGLDDSVLRPIVTLLITQHLFESGSAAVVNAVVLGPSVVGKRRLKVTWTPPKIYDNVPAPSTVTIEGLLSGV
ncbi:DUF4062 domain-containing protein [Rhodococcoides yunnanense]|uniref:DUF4062 domain-containing protein n=1 Tax=Rhodococcoides yunnanense TaxID=278209 RepID=A0ABU4BFE7_9NOCA|nr:DUF4062 domain-containing protein [Rhodococcus yunnanensis]MDV6262905.1 DUF4062 domain-containing protein [Rhodococcus yunnanensis]